MIVEGNGPNLIVKDGKASIPGPTTIPMIKPTAPQKLFPLEVSSGTSFLVGLLALFPLFALSSGDGVVNVIALQGAKFVVTGALEPLVMKIRAIVVL